MPLVGLGAAARRGHASESSHSQARAAPSAHRTTGHRLRRSAHVSRRILLTTDVVGGVWDFAITLAKGLRSAGDDVVLLALGSPTLVQRQAASGAGAQLVSAPLKLEWMNDSAEDVAITRNLVGQIARRVGADVVHANQFAAACIDV